MSVTIVIPAKNEVENISEVIRGCLEISDSILVVDGHSSDGTREVCEKYPVKVIQDNGKGKGDAIRCAIPHIQSDIVVFIDADRSHDPGDIPALIDPILKNAADHVTGSRLIGGSDELHGNFESFLRLAGSALITTVINWRYKVSLSDSQNGFRCLKTDVLKQLDLKENITTIEQEMIIKTLKKGFRMCEVPAHEYSRYHGKSHIRISKVWFRYIYSLVKYILF